MNILPLLPEHWDSVRKIYEEGIATGYSTFETTAPEWESWDNSHLPFGRLVALIDGKVAGWASLSKVSDRCVYAGLAEVSVYVSFSAHRKGVGSALLNALVEESEANNIWTLIAAIFPDNTPSINMHQKLGFRFLGRRERIGKLNGKWHDSLLFERRSKLVGID